MTSAGGGVKNCFTIRVKFGHSELYLQALLDEGSQRSFMTERAAQRLNLNLSRTSTETVNLATFGADRSGIKCLPRSSVYVKSDNGDTELSVLFIPRITLPIRNTTINQDKFPHPTLPLAPRPNDPTIEIDVLIGADQYWKFVGDVVIRGDGPTAVSSTLGGYLLSGPTSSLLVTSDSLTLHILTEQPPDYYDPHRYWELESLGIREDPSVLPTKFNPDEFANSIAITDGHYVTRLPWKSDHPALPSNFAMVNARTRTMVRRLSDSERQTYDTIIRDQLKRQFIEPLSEINTQRGHYLPHYPSRKTRSPRRFESYTVVTVKHIPHPA